jgi:hypothetical protein
MYRHERVKMMSYALLGKIAITTIIAFSVWIAGLILVGKDWGNGMMWFFFLGPIVAVIVAAISWLYLLPPL